MAAVIQRKGQKTWTAVFRDLNGKQLWRRLAAKNRKEAQREADLLEDVAKKRQSGQRLRKTFADLYSIYGEEGQQVSTVRDSIASWLEAKKPETSPATYDSYKTACDGFLEFLGQRADGDIASITRKDLTKFRNTLSSSHAPNTTNRYVQVLKMVFKGAKRDGCVLENVAEDVDTVKNTAEGIKRAFTIPELQAILSVADDEWKSLIRFGLYTGQRLGDLAVLTWANIDMQRGEIRLTTQKTGKRRTLPICEEMAAHILQLPSSDDSSSPIHPRAFDVVERQGKVATLSNWFVDVLAEAGLREKRTHRTSATGRRRQSSLSFHSLRHTANSLLKDAGVPQAVVQELIGHSSEAMSARYTHVGMEALRKAASALPRISEPQARQNQNEYSNNVEPQGSRGQPTTAGNPNVTGKTD
jgi:integrase